MHFGYDPLKQALFCDMSITEHEGAYEKRIEERDAMNENDHRYKSENEVREEGL